jgi:CelD/BcsL family acetyltransferase involved in cellulose biosynthesis
MRIQVHQGSDCFAGLQGAWRELARASPVATPFQTWEWHRTWFHHYGKGKRPYILTAYEGGDLVALYPLARRGGLWSVLRSSGAGPSDYLHPLIRPGYEAPAETAFREHLVEEANASLVDLHELRDDLSSLSLEGENTLEQNTCLVLDLPKRFDDYLATLGKSLRYDVRRLDKSLFKQGKVTIEPVTESGVGPGLDIFFEQHKKRWHKRGLPGVFLGRAQAFHHEWGRQAIAQGWLWLSILRYEDQPIGALYAMTFGPTVYFYQAGFDPAHSALSPGTLLVAQTIRRAIEEEKTTFDFLRGDEPYKRRWKPQREYRNLRKIMAVAGIQGTFGARWNRMGSELRSKVRAHFKEKRLI